MTPTFILILCLFVQQGSSQGFLADWFKQFSYVAPEPREGTCRDCTTREGRFGFDITPTQPTGPCCTVTAPTTNQISTKCGVQGGRRIVGGVESTAGKYPWIAAFKYEGLDWIGTCAGTLVAAEWIVTAAHCLVEGETKWTKDNLKMVLGEHDISSASDSADSNRKVVRLAIDPIVHESYNSPKPHSNDIALLKLAEKVDLNVYTPACLPALNTDYTGKTGRVYGWGATADCRHAGEVSTGPVSILREVAVSIVSNAVCEAASSPSVTVSDVYGRCKTEAFSYNGKISHDMLCAGAQGKDGCKGDSGGPFTVETNNQHELVGVVSWGRGCAQDGLYGVYSDVAKLRTWIDEKIAANGGATYIPE